MQGMLSVYKRVMRISLLLVMMLPLPLRAEVDKPQPEMRDAWHDWPVVGQATLSWLFWDVYHSQLRSPDGQYQKQPGQEVATHPLALEIHYLRTIRREQLLEATEKQWQKLGYSAENIESWMAQLSHLFPTVEKDQRLVYLSDGQHGQLWYFPTPTDKHVRGEVIDPQMNEAFLAIWLSPRSDYPRLRNQLVGKRG
ncbi:putative periplasmic protein [Vibrio metschnikovii]|uniref:hypothetical protein n=1 Tax=Vibrio metschnikovii TaxID=28172 RepID=UPI00031B90A7|nr:hypothetical protein [Vibrio metschnikovii]SUP09328.1 putative periplasmic protein [Vibrio metschnikovii]SUP50362.1 putative periplasmic protein [Vibrio metschnikovii]